MTAATIRNAEAADFGRVAEIYAFEVLHRTATFEIVPPDEVEMLRRYHAVVLRGLPWVVAEVDGRVVGFAYAGNFRARPAYDLTVEDSVYLDPAWQRRGIGRDLLGRIVMDATAAGCRQMLALIGDSANECSIGLHRAMGFEPNGTFRAVGLKFGRWLDVVLMQLALGEGATTLPSRPDGAGEAPPPFGPIS